MIILGIILLIIGFVAKIAIVWTIGIVVLVLGLIAVVLGSLGLAFSSLWLLVLAVFWPQLNTYYNCMNGANTVGAAHRDDGAPHRTLQRTSRLPVPE